MKKIKIEEEPKLQFNRGNPDSPVPPGIDDHDLTGDDEDQTKDVESTEDTNKDEDEEKSTDDQDRKKIKGNKTKNTERLTF